MGGNEFKLSVICSESCVCLECSKQGREWATVDQTVKDLVTTAGFNEKITECGLYFDSIGVKGMTGRRQVVVTKVFVLQIFSSVYVVLCDRHGNRVEDRTNPSFRGAHILVGPVV